MMQRGEEQKPSLGPKCSCNTGFESEGDDADDEDASDDACCDSGADDGDDNEWDDDDDLLELDESLDDMDDLEF